MVYHQWIQFLDRNGKGWCEPEGWIELEDRVLLFEAKLTGGPYGRLQMEGLYKPLLEELLGKPVVCLLVCHNLTTETPGPFVEGPEDLLRRGLRFGTWHWLG